MSVPQEEMGAGGPGPDDTVFEQMGVAASEAFQGAIDDGMPPEGAFAAAEAAAQETAESQGADWSTIEPAVNEGQEAFNDTLAGGGNSEEAWDAAGGAVQAAVGGQSAFDACGDAFFSTYQQILEEGGAPQAAFDAAIAAGQSMAEGAGIDPEFIQGVINAANEAWASAQPVTDAMVAIQAVGDAVGEAVGGGDDGAGLAACGDAAGEAFQEAMDNGDSPTDAFAAAAEAAQQAGADQGMSEEIVQSVVSAAQETYDAAIENGDEPQVAFEAAGEAVAGVTGEVSGFEAVGNAAQDAYFAALDDGETPSAAFDAATSEALGVAESLGMNSEFMQGVIGGAQAAFDEALEGGADASAAFEAAGQAAGEVSGMGGDDGPPMADAADSVLGDALGGGSADTADATLPADAALGEAIDSVTEQGGQPAPQEPASAPAAEVSDAGDDYPSADDSADTATV